MKPGTLVSCESRLSHTCSKASSDPFFTRKRFMAMNIIASPGRRLKLAVIPTHPRSALVGRPAWFGQASHNATMMQVGGCHPYDSVRSLKRTVSALDRHAGAEERQGRRIHPAARARRDIQVMRILL